jgi:hypothetical protein
MRGFVLTCLALLVTMFGCGIRQWVSDNFPMPVDEYLAGTAYSDGYRPYDPEWIGSDVDALVRVRGDPYLILEARPRYGEFRDGIPAVSYVYAPSEGSGQVCFDTYVVVAETRTVVRYYCR